MELIQLCFGGPEWGKSLGDKEEAPQGGSEEGQRTRSPAGRSANGSRSVPGRHRHRQSGTGGP